MDLISPDKYVALRVLFVAKNWATASSMRILFLDCMPSNFYLRVEHVSRSPLYSLFSRLRSTPRLCAFENLCFARSCLFCARIRTGSRHRETRIQILFISEKSFSRSRFHFLNYFQCLKFPFMNLTFSNRQPQTLIESSWEDRDHEAGFLFLSPCDFRCLLLPYALGCMTQMLERIELVRTVNKLCFFRDFWTRF